MIVYKYKYILLWHLYNERLIEKASNLYYIASDGCEDHEQYIIFGYVKNEV